MLYEVITLRNAIALVVHDPEVVVGVGDSLLGRVITSYSIHYTKLYESTTAPDIFACRPGIPASQRPWEIVLVGSR